MANNISFDYIMFHLILENPANLRLEVNYFLLQLLGAFIYDISVA